MAANFAHKVKLSYGNGYGFLRKLCQGIHVHPLTTSSSSRLAIPSRCFSSSSPVAAQVMSSMVSATHLHRSSPWLMLPPEIDPSTNKTIDRFYNMADEQIFKLEREKSLKVPEDARCFGSSRGWLGFIDSNDCSLFLSNPFCDDPLIQLPSIKTLPSILGVERKPSPNPIKNRFKMVGSTNYNEKGWCHYMDPDWVSKDFLQHLTLSCEPFDREEDCTAMIIHTHGLLHQFAFCRVGKEKAWTSLIGANASDIQTVCPLKGINSKIFYPFDKAGDVKLFYSMYSDMFGYGIEAWEIPKPGRIPARLANFMYEERHTRLHEKFKFKTAEHDVRNQCTNRKYLVVDELSGDIMLVIRHWSQHVTEDGTIVHNDPSFNQLVKIFEDGGYVNPYQIEPPLIPYGTLRFDVYKVDMKKQRLRHIENLGDRAIFLGLNQSFTLSACKFPGLRPNSIYFTDDNISMMWTNTLLSYGGHDLGIYNLEDKSIEPCYPFPNELKKDKKIRTPLIWVAPNCTC